MFEYLMPELCLPLFENSMLYESSRFCLYVQKKRTASRKLPWENPRAPSSPWTPPLLPLQGPRLCPSRLRRGMDEELVISPYSSFLALRWIRAAR
jgi:cyclic beta-1,2-glucan synthetase